MFYSFDHIQEKTQCLEKLTATVVLRLNKDKTKLMKVKTVSIRRVMLTEEPVEEVEKFTHLWSVVSTTGGTDQDVEARLAKARLTFRAMDKLWTSQILGRATKVKIFNSKLSPGQVLRGQQTGFTCSSINAWERFWIHTSQTEYPTRNWKKTNEQPVLEQLRRRKWDRIGHTLRRSDDSIAKQVL